jgi:hypothetical protein
MAGMATDGDWHRVAEYVIDRRTDLDMTQADVHAAGGPSTATLRLIEGGLQDRYQPAILARLERVLGWERGSIRAIRKGGEPVLAGDRPAQRGTSALLPSDPPSFRRILEDESLPYDVRLGMVIWGRQEIQRRTEERAEGQRRGA